MIRWLLLLGLSCLCLQATADQLTQAELQEIIAYIQEIAETSENAAQERMNRILATIEEMGDAAYNLPPNAFNKVQQFMGNLGPARNMGMAAETNQEVLTNVQNTFGLNKNGMEQLIPNLPPVVGFLDEVAGPDQATAPRFYGVNMCPYPNNTDPNDCDPNAKYRTIDGSCNNLLRPLWGRAFRPLRRDLWPDYGDGWNSPRLNSNGDPLPWERRISELIFQDLPGEASPVITIGNMVFGQFLDHDVGRTAVTSLMGPDGTTVDVACGEDGCSTEGEENAACWPIGIPEGDPDFWGHKDCLKFVRSEAVTGDDCSLGYRDQMNQITSYIDLSATYGSTVEENDKLRDASDPSRGRLVIMPHPVDPSLKGYMPQKEGGCEELTEEIKCFFSGDTRNNEQIGLTAIHMIFHRNHNFIEQQLHVLNPHWDGDTLYEESRRINIAVWQNIVFKEFLPIVLGPGAMEQYDLKIKAAGPYDPYSPHVNAETSNGYQTAAFRFGHSQISDFIKLTDQTFTEEMEFPIAEVSFRPHAFYTVDIPAHATVDGLILSQMDHEAELMDGAFARSMTRSLFADTADGLGSDLPSLNTHRGREHGLPSYNRWREWCGLSTAANIEDLIHIPVDKRQPLADLYESMEDIDVFVGGSMEIPVAGGITGPLFTCMIARQSQRHKVGDRFWFERDDPVVGFTEGQRASIRKMTLSRVQCDNMDYVETTQKFVQLQPVDRLFQYLFDTGRWYEIYQYWTLYKGDLNIRRPCSQLDELDLGPWAENP